MSPEERQLLQSTYQLSQENHEILRSLRRHQRWHSAGSVIKWVLIIGFTLVAYYQLQPYLERLWPMLESVQGAYESFNSFLPPR